MGLDILYEDCLSAQDVLDALNEHKDTCGDHDDCYYPRTEIDESINQPDGFVKLDENGKLLPSMLSGVLDDVLPYSSLGAFPVEGDLGVLYIATDTNQGYRWNGSGYTLVSNPLVLGETHDTAYRGDRGKIAYDHTFITSGNPHNVTQSDVGLSNVDNTTDLDKPLSYDAIEALANKEDAFDKLTAFNKDFGGGTNEVARGDHTHDALYEPLFSKLTAFNKDFGTGTNEVARGDHTHSEYEFASLKGEPDGYVPLGSDGLIPSIYLPTSVTTDKVNGIVVNKPNPVPENTYLVFDGANWNYEPTINPIIDVSSEVLGIAYLVKE